MTKARIDVHHHLLPDFYKEVQRQAGITGTAYQAFPEWSPESSLKVMDDNGIATAILSYTSPGIFFGDMGQTRELAVRFNDHLATLMRANPARFGGFAMLPLPDVEAAVKEIGRVHDVRVRETARGSIVNMHVDAAAETPVWAVHRAVDELERRAKERCPAIHRIVTHAEPVRGT